MTWDRAAVVFNPICHNVFRNVILILTLAQQTVKCKMSQACNIGWERKTLTYRFVHKIHVWGKKKKPWYSSVILNWKQSKHVLPIPTLSVLSDDVERNVVLKIQTAVMIHQSSLHGRRSREEWNQRPGGVVLTWWGGGGGGVERCCSAEMMKGKIPRGATAVLHFTGLLTSSPSHEHFIPSELLFFCKTFSSSLHFI